MEAYYVTSKFIARECLKTGIKPVLVDVGGDYKEPVKCIFLLPSFMHAKAIAFHADSLNINEEIRDYIDQVIFKVDYSGPFEYLYFGILAFEDIPPENIELVDDDVTRTSLNEIIANALTSGHYGKEVPVNQGPLYLDEKKPVFIIDSLNALEEAVK
jgi:hypothetical protein